MRNLFPDGPLFLPAAVLFRLHMEAKRRQAGGLAGLVNLLDDAAGREDLKRCFSFGAHDLFRDPFFCTAVRRSILPLYAGRPLTIWFPVAGTGCELFSLLVLLAEERPRSADLIHATDFNDAALQSVSSGQVFPDSESTYRANYRKAEGKFTLDDYIQGLESPRLRPDLLARVHFSLLRARTPEAPGGQQFDLIVLRDVLQSWTEAWRETMARVCIASLKPGGFFCAGYRERPARIPAFRDLETFDGRLGIYRKKI